MQAQLWQLFGRHGLLVLLTLAFTVLIHAADFQNQVEFARRHIIPQVHQIVQDARHAGKRRKTAYTLTPVHQTQGEHCIKALFAPVQDLRPRQCKLTHLTFCNQSFCMCWILMASKVAWHCHGLPHQIHIRMTQQMRLEGVNKDQTGIVMV